MNISLKLRLLLVTGATILVAFAGMSWVNVYTFKNTYVQTLREQGYNLTKLIRTQAEQQLARTGGDVQSLARFALQLAAMNDGLSLTLESSIVDMNGNIVAHSSVERIGRPIEPAPASLSWERAGSGKLIWLDDRIVLFVPLAFTAPDGTKSYPAMMRVDFDRAEVSETIWAITTKAFLIALVGLIFVFASNYWFFKRNIEHPLWHLRDAFIEIGEGNLTTPIPSFRDPEFELAARGLKGMVANFRQIVQQMSGLAVDLFEATERLTREFAVLDKESNRLSDNLAESQTILNALRQEIHVVNNQIEEVFLMAQETSSSILQIKGSIEEVDENTTRLHRTLDSTLERLNRITSDIQRLAERNRQVEIDTDEMATAMTQLAQMIAAVGSHASKNLNSARNVSLQAEEGVGVIDSAVRDMHQIREAVEEVEHRSKVLAERSEKIEGILRVINQVAEKTNLLALNAAIIAAQAGEHGRSFAVVAEEIRDLAHRVQASTNEIENLIKGVQDETRSVGTQVRNALEQVGRGEQRVTEAKSKLERILAATRDSDAASQAIAKAMEEQAQVSASISDITGEIQALIHDVSKASVIQADQAKNLSNDSRNVADLSTIVKKAVQEEAEGARRVAESVDRMMKSIKQISDATERQTSESQQISEHTAENLVALQEVVRMIGAFQEHIVKLRNEAEQLDKVLGRFRA